MENDEKSYKSIWIGKNGLGYFVHIYEGISSSPAIVLHPHYKKAEGVSFPEAIESLLNLSSEFYKDFKKIEFEEKPVVEINLLEKITFKCLADKLHNISKENSNLENKIKRVTKELTKDELF
jgi:ribosome biogenesis SPOUT family RNA methylase Rps3